MSTEDTHDGTDATTVKKRPDFITLIAVYHFISAGLLLLFSCVTLMFILPVLLLRSSGTSGFEAQLMVLAIFGMLGVLALGVLYAVAGWGLLKLRNWGRVLAIAIAVPSLLGFPLWTIAGMLVLIYLTTDEARAATGADDSPAASSDASSSDDPDFAQKTNRGVDNMPLVIPGRIPATDLTRHKDHNRRRVVGPVDEPASEQTRTMPAAGTDADEPDSASESTSVGIPAASSGRDAPIVMGDSVSAGEASSSPPSRTDRPVRFRKLPRRNTRRRQQRIRRVRGDQ